VGIQAREEARGTNISISEEKSQVTGHHSAKKVEAKCGTIRDAWGEERALPEACSVDVPSSKAGENNEKECSIGFER